MTSNRGGVVKLFYTHCTPKQSPSKMKILCTLIFALGQLRESSVFKQPRVQCFCGLFGMVVVDTEGQVAQPTAKSPREGKENCFSQNTLTSVNSFPWDIYYRPVQHRPIISPSLNKQTLLRENSDLINLCYGLGIGIV